MRHCITLLIVVALSAFCQSGRAAEDVSVNESVLSAINERLIFLGQSPVVWPNNSKGVSPGVYPSMGFYKEDSLETAIALRSMAILRVNEIRGSFVYFSENRLPSLIPSPIDYTQAPFDNEIQGVVLLTWKDLVRVLKAERYVLAQVGLETEGRGHPSQDWDSQNGTARECADRLWSELQGVAWGTSDNSFLGPAGVLIATIVVEYNDAGYNWPQGLGVNQNRSRLTATGSANFNGKAAVVFLRGFAPSEIDAVQQNLPGYIPADGHYHQYTSMAIPSTGEWIEGPRPEIVETSYLIMESIPGMYWVEDTGVSLGLCSGDPIAYVDGQFNYPADEPPIYPPPDCADCDTPPSLSGAPKQPCPAKTTSKTGSSINNLTLNYQHWGIDYQSASDPASCRSCSGGASGSAGDLPCLQIRRVHRYDLADQPSSLGPAVYLNYDISLRVDGTTVTITDPNASFGLVLTVDATGSYVNATHNLCKRFVLTDAFGVAVVSPQAARVAELETQDGNVYRFEFIDTGDGVLRGRLFEQADRNGNAIQIAHAYAPDASMDALGNDRSKLWQISAITDAHGLSATCTYAAGLIAGRPVISRIDLPTGDHIDYHYNQPALGFTNNDIVGFSGATLPGGDTVSMAASRDNGLVKLVVNDPAAQGIHRNKTVWLTEPNITDPRNGLQVSYQIRELHNGNGEIAYRCRIEALGSDWSTVVQEDAKVLYRLVHDASGTPKQTDHAVTWDWSQPTSTYTWETIGVYTYDSLRRPTQWTTPTGKVYVSIPDPVTNAPARIDHQDGTYSTTTWNAFTQPLTQRDRTGRETVSTYDGNGNRLTQTIGAGTANAATTQWTYNSRGQVLSETDPLGAVTAYTYTAAGFLETMTEPPDVQPAPGETAVRATWTYEYDAAGRRTAMIDPRSDLPIAQRRTTFTWDDRNRLICTTYPDTSTETSVYGTGDEANLVVRMKDRNGRVTVYDHDGAGRRIGTTLYASEQDYLNNTGEVIESCQYLPGTTQESTCWRRGERIQHAFDGRGRRIATTVWVNGATSLSSTTAYDAQGQPWLQTDPYGRRTIQLFDDEDRLVRTIRELVIGGLPEALPSRAELVGLVRVTTPNPPYVVEDQFYDDEGRLVERVDGRGTRTTLVYDARGQVTDVTEDAGQESATTHREFDLAGRPVASVSPRQVTTTTDYTLRGLPRRVTDAAGSAEATVVSERTYSETRKIRFETDANQRVTEYQYGGCCDRLLQVVDPAGFMTAFSYDFVGNRKTVLDPNLILTDMAFDAQNRVWRVANGANEATVTIYDDNLTDGLGLDAVGTPVAAQVGGLGFAAGYADGSAVAVVDPLLKASYEIRDGLGRPVRRIDPLGHVTGYSYDQIVTDTYTSTGGTAITQRLIATAMTDAEAHTTAQWADASGRVRVQVDAEHHATRLAYDPAGNQVEQRDPNGVGWTAVYSRRGFLLARTDTRASAPVTTSWGYDLDGNRISETVFIDGVPKTESYTYDLRNRRTAILDRLAGETRFGYDAVGNLLQITDAQNGVTAYRYDERNLLTQETFPGPTGGTRTYTYDPGRRLKTRTQQAEP